MSAATEIERQEAPQVCRRARAHRIALCIAGSAVAVGLLAHLAVLLWARHELSVVESVVALHASMLAKGYGLYYDLNQYPFTVSPYGPIFYAGSALLHSGGAPLFQGARLITFTALLAALWLVWRALGLLVTDAYARVTGVLLAAGTANLLFWGTVGQVDMLACCLSFAAFVEFLEWRRRRTASRLWMCGLLVVLAVFTKQTALAAGAAIALSLLLEDRRRAIGWIAGVAVAGVSVALVLGAVTGGHYLDNAITANLNPLSVSKLRQHVQYFVLTGGGVLLVALAGVRKAFTRLRPLYIYTLLAAAIWLATAPKIGSDLNYQIETMLALVLCAACALDQLQFFPKCFIGDRGWVTLLQIPLLFHLVLNLALTARTLAVRVTLEPERQAEMAALRPFLEPGRGRVLSAQLDSLVHLRGYIEVEPLVYGMLIEAGVTDPGAVSRDLSARRFGTVILYENVFAETASWKDAETRTLPASQLNEIRKNYRLVRHVDGPYLEGDYVYEPRID